MKRPGFPKEGVKAPLNARPAGARALGRMPTGHMNRLEAQYAEHLERERVAGRVLWWKFEGIKLRLADGCFLTVDFAVMRPQSILAWKGEGGESGHLEMHEVKGFMEGDALVKLKVAASLYPFRFVLVKAVAKKDGGGWSVVEV